MPQPARALVFCLDAAAFFSIPFFPLVSSSSGSPSSPRACPPGVDVTDLQLCVVERPPQHDEDDSRPLVALSLATSSGSLRFGASIEDLLLLSTKHVQPGHVLERFQSARRASREKTYEETPAPSEQNRVCVPFDAERFWASLAYSGGDFFEDDLFAQPFQIAERFQQRYRSSLSLKLDGGLFPWRVGQTAILRGLQTTEVNGTRVRIEQLPAVATGMRYVVRLMPFLVKGIKVRGENLFPPVHELFLAPPLAPVGGADRMVAHSWTHYSSSVRDFAELTNPTWDPALVALVNLVDLFLVKGCSCAGEELAAARGPGRCAEEELLMFGERRRDFWRQGLDRMYHAPSPSSDPEQMEHDLIDLRNYNNPPSYYPDSTAFGYYLGQKIGSGVTGTVSVGIKPSSGDVFSGPFADTRLLHGTNVPWNKAFEPTAHELFFEDKSQRSNHEHRFRFYAHPLFRLATHRVVAFKRDGRSSASHFASSETSGLLWEFEVLKEINGICLPDVPRQHFVKLQGEEEFVKRDDVRGNGGRPVGCRNFPTLLQFGIDPVPGWNVDMGSNGQVVYKPRRTEEQYLVTEFVDGSPLTNVPQHELDAVMPSVFFQMAKATLLLDNLNIQNPDQQDKNIILEARTNRIVFVDFDMAEVNGGFTRQYFGGGPGRTTWSTLFLNDGGKKSKLGSSSWFGERTGVGGALGGDAKSLLKRLSEPGSCGKDVKTCKMHADLKKVLEEETDEHEFASIVQKLLVGSISSVQEQEGS